MNKNYLRIVLMFMTIVLSGCMSRQTVISFCFPENSIPEVTLQLGDRLLKDSCDAAGCATFVMEDVPSGFATLIFGRGSRKMIFVEEGKRLKVNFNRNVNPGESRYSFEGDGAPENQYLEERLNQKPLPVDRNMSEEEFLNFLNDQIVKNEKELSAQPFSPEFKRLEGGRQRYAVLRRFSAFREPGEWSAAIYPFLQEQLKEEPGLLKTDDYTRFVLDALFMMGVKNDPECTPYGITEGQFNYIAENMQDTTVVDFLLGTLLSGYMDLRGVNSIEGFMEIFNQKVHSASWKETIHEKFRKWDQVAKGKTIPEFTFLDINDKEVSLSAFKGKYVFIDYWATWCGPCKQQIPALKELERKYAGKDIVFVSISSDKDRKKWKDMVVKDKLKGVQLIEKLSTASEFSERFVITGIPRFILLDKEGRVYDANAPRPSDPATVKLLDNVLSRK